MYLVNRLSWCYITSSKFSGSQKPNNLAIENQEVDFLTWDSHNF